MQLDALRLPFYSSSHPTGSHGWRNQFDLGNPDLDLLSSWRSHWPTGLPKTRMVGLGLNAVEMEHNPALDEYVVHDLNSDTTFPFDDASFDAVIITVSMQYLVHPVLISLLAAATDIRLALTVSTLTGAVLAGLCILGFQQLRRT